jgi:hypothetical protein
MGRYNDWVRQWVRGVKYFNENFNSYISHFFICIGM